MKLYKLLLMNHLQLSIFKKIMTAIVLMNLPLLTLHAQNIDSFNFGTGNSVVTANFLGGPTSDSAVGSDASILGMERDMSVSATGGATDVTLNAGGATSFLLLNTGLDATGLAQLVWDGPDGAPTTVDCATGLGSIDLTFGGDTLIRIKSIESDKPVSVTFTVYSNCSNFSSLTIALPASTPILNFDFPFSSFVIGGGTGATFTTINALVLDIDATLASTTLFSADYVSTQSGEPLPDLIFIDGFEF